MKAIIGSILTVVVFSVSAYLLFGKKGNKPFTAIPGKNEKLVIQIQPFADISADKVNYVYKEVRKIYTNTIVARPIQLPSQAYYKPRNRYRADTLIAWLSRRTAENYVTIGLTSKDISTDKGDIKDWGVMGLGYQPGNACVVSTFRLSKKNLLDKLFKVSIHELGHTQGLPHCDNKGCFMRDAEGHNTTDEEYEFCPKCRRVLESKGWVFKD